MMLLRFVFVALLACLSFPALAEEAATRNVLLIIADDQGRDLEIYGNNVLKTPNLKALAARGTLFTNAFSTVSSCSPSRSVIYSGLYSHTNGMFGLAHGVHNQHMLDGIETLPVWLKRAGYATALVGKKHILPLSALPFDEELAPEQTGKRDVAFMAEEAGKFLDRSKNKPFFLVVGFSDPHRVTAEGEAISRFGNEHPWPGVEDTTFDPAKISLPSHLPDLPEVRADMADYYRAVHRLDAGIGMFLEQLKKHGREKDTLVIYVSDNGRPFPGAKTTLYDEGIHLPLIVAAPAQGKQGISNDAMVSWIDITPTILDWTGATRTGGSTALPGHSLLPLLEQSSGQGWDTIFASHSFHEINQYYPMRAIRTRQYKFIQNLAHELSYPISMDIRQSPSWNAIEANPGTALGSRSLAAFLNRPAEELYDLAKDPAEINNLAADPAYRDTVTELRQKLTDFRRRTNDPWLVDNLATHSH